MIDIAALYQQGLKSLADKAYKNAHHCMLQILQHDRGYADAYYLLALIAFEHKNMSKAMQLVDKALSLQQQSHYRVLQAKLSVLSFDHVSAKSQADQAVALLSKLASCTKHPAALQWDDLGVVYSQVGCHRQALLCFQQALQLREVSGTVPWSLYSNVAAAYKYCGDMTNAKYYYRCAISQHQALPAAHWSLAMLAPQDAENLELLQNHLRGTDNVDDKLYYAHAIARVLEHQGDYEQAFSILSKVKQQKKVQLHYTFEQDRQLFRVLREITAALKLKTVASDSVEPIFVVGMPRTGTTVVERLLTQSPDITSAGEMPHFPVTFKQQSKTTTTSILDTQTIRASVDMDWALLANTYLAKTRAITGNTRRFVDKMPINFFYIPFIIHALPNAKIICLDRHRQDTIVSNYRQLFASDFAFYHYSNDINDCDAYYSEYQQLVDYWLQQFPDKMYRLTYESFVQSPKQEGQQLFEFIGEPWQDDFINIANNKAPVATASAAQVRSTITRESVGAWRRYESALAGHLTARD